MQWCGIKSKQRSVFGSFLQVSPRNSLMKGALENQDNGEKSAPSSRSGPSQDAFPPSSQQSSFSHSSDAQRRYKRRDDGVQTLGSDGRRFRYKPKLKVPKIPEHLRVRSL